MPENANTEDADRVQMHRMTGPPDSAGADASGRHGGDRRPPRWQRGRSWRAIFFAPVGDGQTRRRGSDATRLGLAVLVVILCWLTTRVNSSSEHTIASVLSSAPNGIRWLVTTIWWVGSVGLIVVVAVLALLAKRWSVIRDVGLAGLGAWLLCIISGAVFGTTGGRPPSSSLHYFDLSFPVARVAATVGVVTAALPYLSRWVQRTIETVLGLLALATVVNGSGLPVAVLASLAVGWGMTALVHIVFGSPLGLQSTDEVALLLGDLKISAVDVVANARQEWGVGRFTGRVDDRSIEVSLYGRDASDAQLLAKTVRFLFYRDSGPTLALTRRQEVEHEAYLTLMAERAGARVPAVLAAGPAGPARDALLVTRPPSGAPLSSFPPYVLPTGPPDSGGGSPGTPDGASPGAAAPGAVAEGGRRSEPGGHGSVADQVLPFDEGVLDDIFRQVMALREAGIAHGSLSTETIVVDEDGSTGMVDFRAASTVANADQLNSDMAATLAALAVVAGPERTVAAAARIVPSEALVDALPFLQRAALAPVASKALRGKKAILNGLRDQGAAAAGVEVPKLIEPRRVSWVNLALVVGTLVGGGPSSPSWST